MIREFGGKFVGLSCRQIQNRTSDNEGVLKHLMLLPFTSEDKMYHHNYCQYWRITKDALRIGISLGPTKQDSIHIPFIGKIKQAQDGKDLPDHLEDDSFRIINTAHGIALIEGEDTSDRIFYTGYERAINRGTVTILDEYTTGAILAQASVQSKKESELACAVLLEIGQRIVFLHLEENRPPTYVIYTSRGRKGNYPEGIRPKDQLPITIDVMDGVEWHARLDAKEIEESPAAYSFI